MYSFNAIQTRLVNRSNEMQQFLGQNESIYSSVAPFAQQVTYLFKNNKLIAQLALAKGKNGKGSTMDKNDLRASIIKSVSSVCTFVSNYALNTANNELYNAVHFLPSDIAKLRDAEIAGFVANIVTVVTPVLSDPDFANYPVTSNILDTLSMNAATFRDNLGKGATQNADSRIASQNINEALKNIQDNINRLNGMISFFKDDYPDFVKGYREASTVNNIGIRHNAIEGTIINSTTSEPIKGVTLTLSGEKKAKTTTTNNKGTYLLDKIVAGTYTLTIAATGYESQAVEVTILRGKTIEVNASLSAQVIEFKTA